MEQKVYLKWEDINIKWEKLDMVWEDIIQITEMIRKTGGISAYVEGNPWDITKRELGEKKAKKFIKLLCKINDLKYEKVIEKNSNVKISISQVERVLNEILKIGIKIF